jgi:hypothetical protein
MSSRNKRAKKVLCCFFYSVVQVEVIHDENHEGCPVRTTTALTNRALLEKFDKLFACNVGDYINLPRLVVVGDQSSGKSSVLEGMTRFKFTRNCCLRTRFATQNPYYKPVLLEALDTSLVWYLHSTVPMGNAGTLGAIVHAGDSLACYRLTRGIGVH